MENQNTNYPPQAVPAPPQKPMKPWYKKWWIWVIIGVVATAILGAVLPRNTTAEKTQNTEFTIAGGQTKAKTSASIETKAEEGQQELVVFNENGIKLTYTGYDDSLFIPKFTFVLENNSNKSFHVSSEDESINDSMISTGIFESVAPGKKVVCDMSVYKSDLEKNGIDKIEKLEFKLHYFNKDDVMESYDSGVITITNP